MFTTLPVSAPNALTLASAGWGRFIRTGCSRPCRFRAQCLHVSQLRVDQLHPNAESLRGADERTAPRFLHETCRSTAAHSVDCELGSATEDSQSCTHRPPTKAQCGRAPGSAARCTAARPPIHSYTASRLARKPRAPPRPGNDASALSSSSGSALTRGRAWVRVDRSWSDQAEQD